jgi:hypothetical protein
MGRSGEMACLICRRLLHTDLWEHATILGGNKPDRAYTGMSAGQRWGGEKLQWQVACIDGQSPGLETTGSLAVEDLILRKITRVGYGDVSYCQIELIAPARHIGSKQSTLKVT